MKELKAGIIGNDEVIVTEANTATAMGSGTLPVFATPALVAPQNADRRPIPVF